MKKRKRISSFELKQQFTELLSQELSNCGFHIVLGFESNYSERVCTLRFFDGNRLEIFVNLSHVRKVTDVKECSLTFRIYYSAFYIVEYIKQIGRIREEIPQTYFEGLVFLDGIEMCRSTAKMGVYSPLALRKGKIKRSYCIRPLEIQSAINVLNRLRLFFLTKMNESDKRVIDEAVDKYLLYASLPEVSYVKAKVPVYSLIESLRKTGRRIIEEPQIVQEYPILALVPFAQIQQMTIKDLFMHCIQSDNTFMLEAGIRIYAFLQVSYEFEDRVIFDRVEEVMKQYIDYSLIYYKEFRESEESLLKDDLYAIKTVVKAINNYLNVYGSDIRSGNIHSIE